MICKDTVNIRKEQVTSDSLPNLFHVNNATSFCTAEWAYHHRYTPKSNMNKSRLPSCCCHAVSMEAGEAVAHGCAHARSSASHVRGSTGFTQKISHHAETMQPDHQHMKNTEFTFSVQCFLFSRDGFQFSEWPVERNLLNPALFRQSLCAFQVSSCLFRFMSHLKLKAHPSNTSKSCDLEGIF